MLAITSARSYRPSKPRQTSASRKRKPRCAAQLPWPQKEMRAKTQEMRAKVVEAEALVPQAMADAFRSGNLGIMDYVRMKNVQADTSMRESIAGGEKPSTSLKANRCNDVTFLTI